jgi:hypothetical protein
VESSETSESHVAIKGGRDSTQSILHKSELFIELIGFGDHNTHHHIGVTTNVLGDRVNHEVSSEIKRVLAIRRHESVVYDQKNVSFVSDLSQSSDVSEFECGVGRSFHPKEFGVFLEGSVELFFVVHINKGGGDVGMRFQNSSEVSLSTSIHIVNGDDVVSVVESLKDRACGSHTRGERNTVVTVLNSGHGKFKGTSSRIACSRVLKAAESRAGKLSARELSRALLSKRSGQRDGRHNSPCKRIGILASMNGKSAKTVIGTFRSFLSLLLGVTHNESKGE